MALFGGKKKESTKNSDKKLSKMVTYIEHAGGCIVTRSLLEGTSQLKWLFREESEQAADSGWRAFGAEDTQEYIDNPDNVLVCDFNTLANLEPAVLNIYEMPVGADLEFKYDSTGRYFVDTQTGQEIRTKVESPIKAAFKENLKFLQQNIYNIDAVSNIFKESDRIKIFHLGDCELATGSVVIADPLCYLQDSRYSPALRKTVLPGNYPVFLSILDSAMAGIRITAAKLKISDEAAVRYDMAESDMGQPDLAGFGVDAGMGCFCDIAAAEEYRVFLERWYKDNPGKNIYDDYFASLFAESYTKYPQWQREGGDFIMWENPLAQSRIPMFASGLGDGFYPGLWGMDAGGDVCELVILFMNPELF